MSWKSKWPSATGWDLGSQPTIVQAASDILKQPNQFNNLKREGSNLIDADKNLYFQCDGCDKLFDPATKSFATLHDFAHKQGWKVKWNVNGQGYKIYCPKCMWVSHET